MIVSGCVCFVCSLVSVAVGLCFDWSLVLVHNSDYQLNHVGCSKNINNQ